MNKVHFRLSLAVAACGAWLGATGPAEAADAPPPVQPVTVRAVAHFDFNKTTIRPDDRPAILAEVGKMKGVTWQAVKATGYTDSVGRPRYNQKLSARRAAAVKAYLVGQGLDPKMIKTEGKAAAAPLAPNDTDDGRARNRRTEIEFEGVQAVAP